MRQKEYERILATHDIKTDEDGSLYYLDEDGWPVTVEPPVIHTDADTCEYEVGEDGSRRYLSSFRLHTLEERQATQSRIDSHLNRAKIAAETAGDTDLIEALNWALRQSSLDLTSLDANISLERWHLMQKTSEWNKHHALADA